MTIEMVMPAFEWDEEDKLLFQFLLEETPPDGLSSPSEASSSPVKPKAPCAQASTKARRRAKLTPSERRAKHREVVKRSYHRNKEKLSGLRETVSSLEAKLEALSQKNGGFQVQDGGNNLGRTTVSASDRAENLVRLCRELNTESSQLQAEAQQLRETFNQHRDFLQSLLQLEQERVAASSSSEEEFYTDEEAFPTTSDEEFSPLTKDKMDKPSHAFTKLPMHVNDSFIRSPIDTAARRELHFKPLTHITARQMVDSTLQSIGNFRLNGQVISTGGSVFGWEDRRVQEHSAIHFSLRKRFASTDAEKLLVDTWECFADVLCTKQKFQGVLLELRVLQHIDDDTLVAVREAKCPGDNKVYRFMHLLFRVRTSDGFLLCIKSFENDLVVNKNRVRMSKEGLPVQWVDNSGWFHFRPTGFNNETAEVEYGGSVDYGDMSSVPDIAMRVLSVVLRWEAMIVGPMFTLPSSGLDVRL